MATDEDNVVAELLDTEVSHKRIIEELCHLCLRPLRELSATSKALLSPQEVNTVFSNLEQLVDCSEVIITALTNQGSVEEIGQSFLDAAPLLESYSFYCANYSSARKLLKAKMVASPKLADFFEKAECKAQHFRSIFNALIAPVQRVTRYIMLLEKLVKRTPEDQPGYRGLSLALAVVTRLADNVNQIVKHGEEVREAASVLSSIVNLAQCLPKAQGLSGPATQFRHSSEEWLHDAWLLDDATIIRMGPVEHIDVETHTGASATMHRSTPNYAFCLSEALILTNYAERAPSKSLRSRSKTTAGLKATANLKTAPEDKIVPRSPSGKSADDDVDFGEARDMRHLCCYVIPLGASVQQSLAGNRFSLIAQHWTFTLTMSSPVEKRAWVEDLSKRIEWLIQENPTNLDRRSSQVAAVQKRRGYDPRKVRDTVLRRKKKAPIISPRSQDSPRRMKSTLVGRSRVVRQISEHLEHWGVRAPSSCGGSPRAMIPLEQRFATIDEGASLDYTSSDDEEGSTCVTEDSAIELSARRGRRGGAAIFSSAAFPTSSARPEGLEGTRARSLSETSANISPRSWRDLAEGEDLAVPTVVVDEVASPSRPYIPPLLPQDGAMLGMAPEDPPGSDDDDDGDGTGPPMASSRRRRSLSAGNQRPPRHPQHQVPRLLAIDESTNSVEDTESSRASKMTDGSSKRAVFVFIGEVGCGKSVLLEETADLARRHGFRTFSSDGNSQVSPLATWRTIVSELLGVADYRPGTLEDRVRRTFVDLLSVEDLPRLPLLNTFLPTSIPETAVTKDMAGKERLEESTELLRQIIVQVARNQPVMVLLDSVQWMDPGSWWVTDFLIRAGLFQPGVADDEGYVNCTSLAMATRPLNDEAGQFVLELLSEDVADHLAVSTEDTEDPAARASSLLATVLDLAASSQPVKAARLYLEVSAAVNSRIMAAGGEGQGLLSAMEAIAARLQGDEFASIRKEAASGADEPTWPETFIVINVPPLQHADSLELVRRRLDALTLPPVIEQFVLEKARGNPMLLEDIANLLLQTQTVEVNLLGVCSLVGNAEVTREALEAMFVDFDENEAKRLSRLAASQQELLKVAAVFGPVFPAAGVLSLLPESSQEDFDTEVAALVGEGIVVLGAGGRSPSKRASRNIGDVLMQGDLLDGKARRVKSSHKALEATLRSVASKPFRQDRREFEFSRERLHSTAYDLVLDGERRAIHRQVAEWYLSSSQQLPLYSVAALHMSKGGRSRDAFTLHVAAGHQAWHAHNSADAVRELSQALELMAELRNSEEAAPAVAVHLELPPTPLVKSLSDPGGSVRKCVEGPPQGSKGGRQVSRGRFSVRRDKTKGSDKEDGTLPPFLDPLVEARVHYELGSVMLSLGKREAFLASMDRALLVLGAKTLDVKDARMPLDVLKAMSARLKGVEDERDVSAKDSQIAEILLAAAFLFVREGRRAQAVTLAVKAVNVCEVGPSVGLAFAYMTCALGCATGGKRPTALRFLEAARTVLSAVSEKDTDEATRVARVLAVESLALLAVGQIGPSASVAERAIAIAQNVNDSLCRPQMEVLLALCQWTLGRLDVSEAIARTAMNKSGQDIQSEARAAAIIVGCLLETRRFDEAASVIKEIQARVAVRGPRDAFLSFMCGSLQAHAHVRAGKLGEAWKWLCQAEDSLEQQSELPACAVVCLSGLAEAVVEVYSVCMANGDCPRGGLPPEVDAATAMARCKSILFRYERFSDNFSFAAPKKNAFYGWYHCVKGRMARGVKELEKTVEVNKKKKGGGRQLDTALAWLLLARFMLKGRARTTAFSTARTIFSELSAYYWLHICDRAETGRWGLLTMPS